MTQSAWFPVGADQKLGGWILPRCDDPPTTALALDAAMYAVQQAAADKEERDGRNRR
jgi:hypothetical protein